MDKKQFLATLRSAPTVFVCVQFIPGDIFYMQATKIAVRAIVEHLPDDAHIDAVLREDGDLYIA